MGVVIASLETKHITEHVPLHIGSEVTCYFYFSIYDSKEQFAEEEITFHNQGGHGTEKTGNLAVNFSRQGKHREFSKFYFLHRENCGNTGKILKI